MVGSEQDSPAESGTATTSQTKAVKSSCDLCKRMKIKRDRQGRSCKHCAARNLDCTVTRRERKKRIVRTAEYIATIEDRIQRMEVVINAAGLAAHPGERESIVDEIGGQAGFSDRMSTLMIGEEGPSQFIGASSAFSLFSPRGLQWIREKTRGQDTERLLRAIAGGYQPWSGFSSDYWRSRWWRPDAEQAPLPTKEVGEKHVNAYFHLFNAIFPIYEETRFRALYERQYSLNPPTGAAWYASLNIVLALGSVLLQKVIDKPRRSVTQTDLAQDTSWTYFRNASSKFTELLFKPTEIVAVQAILCMSFMLRAIPDPQPAYILAAAAVRLSHGIGLHRSLDEFGLDAIEKKQRQNVFWVAYAMEAGVSLRSGRPPAMSDQDIAVALPQMTFVGFDHFRCMTTLSLLESRVYSELYSAKAATRSGLERLKSIGRLDAELTRWRDAIPLGYRPESEIVCSEHEFTPVIMMHFGYYNCLTAIHRASIHHGSWTSDPDSESRAGAHAGENLNPRVYISSSLCLEASRNIIGLLRHFDRDFPRGSLIVTAIYYPLSATLTLFANILQNPRSTEAFSDIDLMGVVTAYLNQSAQFHQHLEGIVRIFAELNHVAGLVVRDAQMTQLSELKRQTEEAAADDDWQDLSYTPSRGLPTHDFAFPPGSDDAIPPTINYPYSDLVPFDQSQFYVADASFLAFPSGSTDMWTEPVPEDFTAETNMW